MYTLASISTDVVKSNRARGIAATMELSVFTEAVPERKFLAMTTHLTLVVDNSARGNPVPTDIATHHSPPERKDLHWVHRAWRPRRARRSFVHPIFRALGAQLRDTRGAVTAEYAIVIIRRLPAATEF